MIDIEKIINSSSKYNFHSHTQFCDGRNNMEEMVIAAIEGGFTDYGFTPHSPVPFFSSCNINEDDVKKYLAEADRLKKEYGDKINLYTSFEIDYLNVWGASNEYFQNMPLDYRLSSVHFIPSFVDETEFIDVDGNFENFKVKMEKYFYNDIDGVVLSFYTQTLKMIETGGFDIIGHFDKIGYNASEFRPGIENEDWYNDLVKETFDAIMDCKYWIEINTKAFIKCGRFFPNEKFWKMMKKYNAPVIFNSDAHFADLVNSGRAEAMQKYDSLVV